MVCYAAGARYLSLIGGVCMSFYDWYCDLPPSSPQTWGEQTDVPESADWYNSSFIIAWGSNVPQTRTPDAHFFTEVRYKGTKIVAITPDYSEVAKLSDIWLHPKQGTDAALAMAMGHVILKEFYFPDEASAAVLRRLHAPLYRHADAGDVEGAHAASGESSTCPTAMCAHRTSTASSGKPTIRNGRRSRSMDWQSRAAQWRNRLPLGRRTAAPTKGQWNLEAKEAHHGEQCKTQAVAARRRGHRETAKVGFPYFGGIESEHFRTTPWSSSGSTPSGPRCSRRCATPGRRRASACSRPRTPSSCIPT